MLEIPPDEIDEICSGIQRIIGSKVGIDEENLHNFFSGSQH